MGRGVRIERRGRGRDSGGAYENCGMRIAECGLGVAERRDMRIADSQSHIAKAAWLRSEAGWWFESRWGWRGGGVVTTAAGLRMLEFAPSSLEGDPS